MDRCCGRVNPPQLASNGKLLRTQGNGKYDFRIAEMLLCPLVAVQMHDLNLRELSLQLCRKPRWDVPKIEPVVDHDQQLHDCGDFSQRRFNHRPDPSADKPSRKN